MADIQAMGRPLRTNAAIIVGICYGKQIVDLDDEYIRLAQLSVEGIIQTKAPGTFWMDYFPLLKHVPAWIPGATGRRLSEYYSPIIHTMRDQPFYAAKDDVVGCYFPPQSLADLTYDCLNSSMASQNPQ
ncbi:hypothetical protein PHLCEN_2v4605 [Hermanssonia centrifuga]|uniref:Uncharacterized protein n=1 Tax=Hermanssonia centrifuga TaxID=98765 RepID=A0A2R6PMS6_9APHY|nr:hypothetical protein PHLCEN_2v4605 [Hermanssonia centrifuga]